MNRILLLIVGTAFFILGYLGRVYFRHYRGNLIPNPHLFYILSWICLVTGVLLVAWGAKLKLLNKHREFRKAANKLKLNGEKIIVPFDQCEVKEGEYCVIIYNYNNPRTGLPEKFISEPITKDRVTLSIYLEKQKRISIYVDRSDRSKYYFDLEFLPG